jgi:hypothetical protein
MLVIVASRHDSVAQELIQRWAPFDAALLSCEDVSTPGWRFRPADCQDSIAVISGQRIPARQIRGILTRRPSILQEELSHIADNDRAYVAAEMNAFLLAWLSGLNCPTLNRPTALCLSGPNWRPEQWLHAAHLAGIAVQRLHRSVALFLSPETPIAEQQCIAEVTVIGNRCCGATDKKLHQLAIRLAQVAGVGLLGVRFNISGTQPCFLAATLWPDLSVPHVADSVCDYLVGRTDRS